MKRSFILFLGLMLTLGACNQTEPTPLPEEVAVATTVPATATITATTAPTRTATPTPGPPTATATRVVTRRPTATPSPTPAPQTYIVQQNDTLFGIAVQFGLTTAELAQANQLGEDELLQPGQTLLIPASEPTPEAATEAQPAAAEVAAPAPPSGSALGLPAYSGPPLPELSHPAGVNPLTGLPVSDPAMLRRRPLIVRVGNDVGARQSQIGLNQADLVYEEIAEWWVTRFSAIYLATTPAMIAPVRSARLINVQLAPQYQAALAHSGGSDPVRWEISQAPIANLDEYFHPAPYFYRENQGWQTRLAIDAEAARNHLVNKGLEAAVTQQGFVFSETPAGGEPGPDIYIPYPKATSFTEWHYDSAGGKYLRWINGFPLIDAGDGRQVSAANVIIYFAEHRETDIVEDSNGATSVLPIINGVGPAWFFRDGVLMKGSWLSDGTRTPYFVDESGDPYALKPGNSWVEVVPTHFKIGLNSAEEAGAR